MSKTKHVFLWLVVFFNCLNLTYAESLNIESDLNGVVTGTKLGATVTVKETQQGILTAFPNGDFKTRRASAWELSAVDGYTLNYTTHVNFKSITIWVNGEIASSADYSFYINGNLEPEGANYTFDITDGTLSVPFKLSINGNVDPYSTDIPIVEAGSTVSAYVVMEITAYTSERM